MKTFLASLKLGGSPHYPETAYSGSLTSLKSSILAVALHIPLLAIWAESVTSHNSIQKNPLCHIPLVPSDTVISILLLVLSSIVV